MSNFKKEIESRLSRLERELTDYNIWINSIRTEVINLQITVKKLKDITEFNSYEYKTELVKKNISPETMTATETIAKEEIKKGTMVNSEDLVPEPGQTIKFKK